MGQPLNTDLDDPKHYINRELSLLAFHARVLEQAKDERTPLLERVRFLAISTTILDEFFEVRVAKLKQQVVLGVSKTRADGLTPRQALVRIHEVVSELVTEQYRVFNDVILPALEAEGIQVVPRNEWSAAQKRWVEDYFKDDVLPVLTPVGLDPSHPFPRILNKSLNFIITLTGEDAFDRDVETAVVAVPRILPRLIAFPEAVGGGPNVFVLLSSVIHAHVGELFPGLEITGCYQFRVTRNSDLWVEEEEVDDLLDALKGELPRRRYGAAVRLEMPTKVDPAIASFLCDQFGLVEEEDLHLGNGPVNLHRLQALHKHVDRPDLKYAPFNPGIPRESLKAAHIFDLLRRQDLLLHHPYQSFSPVMDLLRSAANDPKVLAIQQTVYRTGAESAVAEALLAAARKGKEVTAVIELKARFDEAANIDLATRLQEAGAKVVYGIVGHKTHAKMLLVVRREGGGLRRYCHLGTGNYHPGTARAYTDISYMTSDPVTCRDVHKMFQQLTGLGRIRGLKRLLQAPFTLHPTLLERVAFEAAEAQAGRPARIVAKMNSLVEPQIIRALYEASRAGVEIDLVVRGMCCLRAGVPNLSDTIRVRSIVGRFLEHSRIFSFHAAGEEVVLCSSADWMGRNMFRRVEAAWPIPPGDLRTRLCEELEVYLHDSAAWELRPDGTYTRAGATGERLAQELLLAKLTDQTSDLAATQSAHRPRRSQRHRRDKGKKKNKNK